jgi:hypothetical protein
LGEMVPCVIAPLAVPGCQDSQAEVHRTSNR